MIFFFIIGLIMRIPCYAMESKMSKGTFTRPLISFICILKRYRLFVLFIYIYISAYAILFHAWNPIAYLLGKIARRTFNKGWPSVKRLGNCSSAVGRPAEDDAIFEDNATTTLFCSGKFLSSRSNRWKQRKAWLHPLNGLSSRTQSLAISWSG